MADFISTEELRTIAQSLGVQALEMAQECFPGLDIEKIDTHVKEREDSYFALGRVKFTDGLFFYITYFDSGKKAHYDISFYQKKGRRDLSSNKRLTVDSVEEITSDLVLESYREFVTKSRSNSRR